MKNKKWYLLTIVLVGLAVLVVSLGGCTPTAGKDGIDGKDGVNGKDGMQGIRGIQGIQGIQGIGGADGNGIINTIYDNITGTVTIYYTNGSSYTTGNLKGANGIGIVNTTYLNGKITLHYSDNSTFTTGDLRGANGASGIGLTGATGDKGDKGDTGIGLANPKKGLANAISIVDPFTNDGVISGAGVFTIIGAATITGTIHSPYADWIYPYGADWFSNNVYGEFTIMSFDGSYTIVVDIFGSQGSGTYALYVGTYTVKSGGEGSGSITATIKPIDATHFKLHISVVGVFS